MKTKAILSSVFAIAGLTAKAPSAFSQAALIGDVMYSGGMPMPNAPASSGASLFSDGRVITYKNFYGRTLETTVATLSSQQVSRLLDAGSALLPVALIRDTTQPQCADAPTETVSIVNAAGQMVAIKDEQACVPGYRPDDAGAREAGFLEALVTVAQYGESL